MADITIKDFRGGLDARKFVLSQPAGVLTIANNAHINQGAELEKRKAFTLVANSSGAVSTSLPSGTFGWLALVSSHVVFGSQDGAALTFPSGVTYQRLQHPAVLAGTAYNGALHAMTAVVASEVYGGKAWVAAKFADENTYGYYDGSLINDFTSGLILAYLAGNDGKIATALTALVNRTSGYTATQQGSTGKLDVFSLPGNLYTTAINKSSTNGTLAAQLLNNGLASVASVQAAGQFQVVTGSVGATNSITSVKANNVELLKNSTAILYVTDEATTAAAVAVSISSAAGTHGYYAVATGPLVSILPLTGGTSTNGYEIKVTTSGTVCIGTCALTIGGDSTVGMTSILSSAILGRTTLRAHALFVATLTIGTHSFLVGEVVTVSGMGDTRYNGSFTITAITATTIAFNTSTSFTEASVADTGGNVVYTTGSNIMGGPVGGTTNGLNALASNIATAIRGTAGFTANAVSATIYISKVTTSSNDAPISLVVTPAAAGLTVSSVQGSTQIGLTAYNLTIAETLVIGTATNDYSTTVPANFNSVSVAIGGTSNPPFSYLWTVVTETAHHTGVITPANKTSATPGFKYAGGDQFTKNMLPFTYRSTWKCTITDSVGNTFTTPNLDLVVTVNYGSIAQVVAS